MGSLVNQSCGCVIPTGDGWETETTDFIDALQGVTGLLPVSVGNFLNVIVLIAKAGGAFNVTATADSVTLTSAALEGINVSAIGIDGGLRPATDNGVDIWRKGNPGDTTAQQKASGSITLLQSGASFVTGQRVTILQGS